MCGGGGGGGSSRGCLGARIDIKRLLLIVHVLFSGWSKELTNQIPPRAHPKLFPSKWSQCDLMCGDWHTRNVPSLLALCPQAIPMLLIIAGDIEENPGPPKLNGVYVCMCVCVCWGGGGGGSSRGCLGARIDIKRLLLIVHVLFSGWSKELTNQIPPRAHPKLFPSKWSQCDLVCGDWHTRNVPSLLALCPQVTTMLLIIAGDIEENPGPPKLNGVCVTVCVWGGGGGTSRGCLGARIDIKRLLLIVHILFSGWSKELTNQIPPRAHPELFPSKWSQCDLVCGDWHTRNVPSLLALCPQVIPMLLIIAGDIEENPGPPKINGVYVCMCVCGRGGGASRGCLGARIDIKRLLLIVHILFPGWSEELTNQIPPRAHPKLFPSKWSLCDLVCGDWHTRNVPSLLALCPQVIPMLLIIAGDIEENPGPPKINGVCMCVCMHMCMVCVHVHGVYGREGGGASRGSEDSEYSVLIVHVLFPGWSEELTNQIPPRAHPELFTSTSKWCQCDLVCRDWHTRNVPSLLARCPQVIPMLLIIAGDIEENPGPPKQRGTVQ